MTKKFKNCSDFIRYVLLCLVTPEVVQCTSVSVYVKLRTVMRAAYVFSVLTINKCIDDCNTHNHDCQCDTKVNNGCDVLGHLCIFICIFICMLYVFS